MVAIWERQNGQRTWLSRRLGWATCLLPTALLCRYEMAAGFFLLAGSVYDAVSVLARECGDPQLALFVARLVDFPSPGSSSSAPRVSVRLVQQVGLLCAVCCMQVGLLCAVCCKWGLLCAVCCRQGC